MKKVYYLSTCDTCKRIMNSVPDLQSFEQIDIKADNISAKDLDIVAEKMGGYEQVFSKRARKFRGQGWHEKSLSDKEYRQLILDEYTFLKRPVFMIDDAVFVGNAKKNVTALIEYLNA